jgi:hypothetical protein
MIYTNKIKKKNFHEGVIFLYYNIIIIKLDIFIKLYIYDFKTYIIIINKGMICISHHHSLSNF